MPNGPVLPATIRNSQRRRLPVSTKSGTVYRQMPEKATMIIAGEETNPAETAVSPSTSAPTTESAMPTYFGMRMLASFKISSTSNTRNISKDGESGNPRMLPAIVSVKFSGIS